MSRFAATRGRRVARVVAASSVLVAASACSLIEPRKPDVVREVSPNVFEIAQTGGVLERRGSELRMRLFERGLAFCQQRGRGFSVLDERSVDASEGDDVTTGTFASATVHFSCQ